jgi:lysophospholipase L1-like esterase/PKD repeat protein
LGDSITTAYDANGTAIDLGEQPYYSYGVGWNTTVFSLWKRLESIYGEGSITPHLLAVPGDKADDMVWQALDAVQNHSGFITILIGGNDACHHDGSTPTPTPVWNFSESLNRTFKILRHDLPASTVISLGNVVNVSELDVLFASNVQAQGVYSQECPILNSIALGNTTAAQQLNYMIDSYNRMEVQIASLYNVTLWDMHSLNFSSSDVNTLDYFHPSPLGHQAIAYKWWAVLPYAKMLPRMVNPTYPTSVPVGAPLPISVEAWDANPVIINVTATYRGYGQSQWSTVPLNQSSGFSWNGTFSATLPANATAFPGALDLYLSADDWTGYNSTLPADAPVTFYTVNVTGNKPYTVNFMVDPEKCGPVSFNGTMQANGSSAQYPDGVYTMQAQTCSGYTFAQGTFRAIDGRSQILNSPYGNFSVSMNGTLWANYTINSPPPSFHYTLNFVVQPTVCGPITFNGTSWANQTYGSFLGSSYPAVAPSCASHTFDSWSVTGSLVLSGSSSTSISVTVQGNGTLTASYTAAASSTPLVAFGNSTVTSYPGICNSGANPAMTVSFAGSARGGAPPYTWSWGFGDGSTAVSGQNSTHGYRNIADENATLTVTDSSGKQAMKVVPVTITLGGSTSCPPKLLNSTSTGFSILGLGTVMSVVVIVVIAAAAVTVASIVILRRRRRSRDFGSLPTQAPPSSFPPYP